VRLDGDEMAADADDGDAGHYSGTYISFHDPYGWSKDDVSTGGVCPKPISTWRHLRRNHDLAIEGEVRGGIDTFSEHNLVYLQSRRRHEDRDVLERTLGFAALAVATTTRATDGRVVALVCPIRAANGDRFSGMQLRRRRDNEIDPRREACGVRRRQAEGGNE
jgi:hypothetical protein